MTAAERISDGLRRADEGHYGTAWYFNVDRRDVERVLAENESLSTPSRAAYDVDDEAPVTIMPERVALIAQEADVRYPEAADVLKAAGFTIGLSS